MLLIVASHLPGGIIGVHIRSLHWWRPILHITNTTWHDGQSSFFLAKGFGQEIGVEWIIYLFSLALRPENKACQILPISCPRPGQRHGAFTRRARPKALHPRNSDVVQVSHRYRRSTLPVISFCATAPLYGSRSQSGECVDIDMFLPLVVGNSQQDHVNRFPRLQSLHSLCRCSVLREWRHHHPGHRRDV